MADKKKIRGGNAANIESFGAAERRLARKKRHLEDPEPHLPREGVYPNRKGKPPNWSADELGLPVESPCPVQPLGHKDGEYFYISSSDEFRAVIKHDHEALQKLFALCPNWPAWARPRYGKVPRQIESADDDDDEESKPKVRRPPPIEGFHDDGLRTMLLRACERQGIFDPDTKMRGRGGWTLRGGALIYHAGEELWVYEGPAGAGRFKMLPVGMHDGQLYPRLAELPAPWRLPIDPADNQAGNLFRAYQTFNWRRPKIDPLLMLGWTAIAYLGGAVDWRASICLVGDKGTGKSTLQDGVKALFGAALLDSANASAAYVYQRLAHDSCPCAIDELEPGAHAARVNDMIELMRQSASGAIAGRGSAGGQAVSYQMRSAFLFSAINNPIYDPADLSRVAILRMQPLEPGKTEAPVIDAERCGPMILGRLMSQWSTFYEVRRFYMRALAMGGHDARGQKTYGTLLAGAELLLGAELADEFGIEISRTLEGGENTKGLAWWAEHLAVSALPEAELSSANWMACTKWLLTKAVEPWRGGARTSVGAAISDLVAAEKTAASGMRGGTGDDKGPYTSDQCKRDLARVGLGLINSVEVIAKFVRAAKAGGEDVSQEEASAKLGLAHDAGWLIAVPGDHPELRALFRDQKWARTWTDALRQCPVAGVMITHPHVNRVTIAGTQERCTLIVWQQFQEAPER